MQPFDPAAEFDIADNLSGQFANGAKRLDAEPMPGDYRQLVGIEISREPGTCAGVSCFVLEIIVWGCNMVHVKFQLP